MSYYFLFSNILVGSGYTALDMDKPLCDMGFPGFLCVFQLLLGRSNMVRIQLRIKKNKNKSYCSYFSWPFHSDSVN